MPLALIDIALIDNGTRLRDVSEAQVESLMESIAEIGLLNPITVYERPVVRGNNTVAGFGIVAGAHRKVACERLGLAEIEANVVTLSELQRQIAECDENLRGPQLGKADLALFTRRRKEAYEALHPEAKAQTRQGHIRQGAADANLAPAFTADTAAKTGRSERAIQRDAERGEKVIDEVLDLIRGTKLDTGSYLDVLKKMEPNDQMAAARRDLAALKAEGKPRLVPKPSAPLNDIETRDKWLQVGMSWWNRGSKEWREEFLSRVDTPVMDSKNDDIAIPEFLRRTQ